MEKIELISYGPVSKTFKGIANLRKQMFKVINGDIEQYRVDCYKLADTEVLKKKFTDLGIDMPREIEIFYPSEKYPPHIDGGSISYFVPLETGNFYINGITYPIVPFVLYAFDDGKIHGTNFCAIMLK